jgi:hypothetical protein
MLSSSSLVKTIKAERFQQFNKLEKPNIDTLKSQYIINFCDSETAKQAETIKDIDETIKDTIYKGSDIKDPREDTRKAASEDPCEDIRKAACEDPCEDASKSTIYKSGGGAMSTPSYKLSHLVEPYKLLKTQEPSKLSALSKEVEDFDDWSSFDPCLSDSDNEGTLIIKTSEPTCGLKQATYLTLPAQDILNSIFPEDLVVFLGNLKDFINCCNTHFTSVTDIFVLFSESSDPEYTGNTYLDIFKIYKSIFTIPLYRDDISSFIATISQYLDLKNNIISALQLLNNHEAKPRNKKNPVTIIKTKEFLKLKIAKLNTCLNKLINSLNPEIKNLTFTEEEIMRTEQDIVHYYPEMLSTAKRLNKVYKCLEEKLQEINWDEEVNGTNPTYEELEALSIMQSDYYQVEDKLKLLISINKPLIEKFKEIQLYKKIRTLYDLIKSLPKLEIDHCAVGKTTCIKSSPFKIIPKQVKPILKTNLKFQIKNARSTEKKSIVLTETSIEFESLFLRGRYQISPIDTEPTYLGTIEDRRLKDLLYYKGPLGFNQVNFYFLLEGKTCTLDINSYKNIIQVLNCLQNYHTTIPHDIKYLLRYNAQFFLFIGIHLEKFLKFLHHIKHAIFSIQKDTVEIARINELKLILANYKNT